MPSVTDAAIDAQLAKILASDVFSRSSRMSRFLRLIVARAGSGLKEYTIALEVFDRPPDFDPRIDPLVRVEARRLRQKLAEYYDADGREDSILIDLPKGTYTPGIRLRETSAPAREARSVVVLPFLNLGGEGKDYFVDGLSEELTAVLAQVPDLRVIARTSAFAFKGKAVDVRAIGRKLNVATVLEGSVRWSGPRLRVTVQMAECRDGCHLFAESFELEEKEIFAVQNEIAHRISDALAPRLRDAAAFMPRPPQPVEPEAYQLYLRGRYHWNRRTLADFEKAIAYCERAIAIQPNFAAAYACIADACWTIGLDMLAPARELLPKGRAAAARALDVDPDCAEAHSAFGIYCMFDWNHELGGAHMRRAIELKPSYATAHYVYSCNLAVRGDMEASVREIRAALALDPLSVVLNRVMVIVLCTIGDFAGAAAQGRQTIELDPAFYGSHLYLAWAYMGLRQNERAIEELEQARRLGGSDPVMLGYVAASKAQLGRRDEAESIVRRLLDLEGSVYVPPLVVAVALVALGEMDRALDFLERAVDERCGTIVHLRLDPFFLTLHGNQRFENLCRRMNLA
jgi:adenylate cyclase